MLGVEPKEGLYRVRLRFREPCPTFMIKSAVLDDGTPQAKAEVQESDASA